MKEFFSQTEFYYRILCLYSYCRICLFSHQQVTLHHRKNKNRRVNDARTIVKELNNGVSSLTIICMNNSAQCEINIFRHPSKQVSLNSLTYRTVSPEVANCNCLPIGRIKFPASASIRPQIIFNPFRISLSLLNPGINFGNTK